MSTLLSRRIRFVLPLILTATIKLVIANWVLWRSLPIGPSRRAWLPGPAWVNVFWAWDSNAYIVLAKNWYPSWGTVENRKFYAFMPGYPALIRLGYYIFHDYLLAAVVLSLILGAVSVPLFQFIAERYRSRRDALSITVIFAFFPYVFLFTSVAYTESLFLFSTLACWLLHKSGRPYASAISATIAALAKLYGILVVVPVAFELIRSRRLSSLPALSIPLLSLVGWGYYCFTKTGDWFAPLYSERVIWGRGWAEAYLFPLFVQGLTVNAIGIGIVAVFAVSGLSFIGLKLLRSFDDNFRPLALYSVLTLLVIMYSGVPDSMIRFVSFVFPLWLAIPAKSMRLTFACIPFFVLVSAALWFEFAMLLWVA